MKEEIHFTKMHGLGNDYIYINTDLYPIADPETFAIKWSSYHTGIGSDGVILISKETDEMYRMRIFNADGSEALMCGNGIRCVVKYLYDRQMIKSDEIDILTNSGVKHLKLDIKDKKVAAVTVDMNPPTIDSHINTVQIGDTKLTGVSVGIGNPHWVTFITEDPKTYDLSTIGPNVEHDDQFPNRTNFEIAYISAPSTIEMRVWERGSGLTMACGTGACATAVAAIYEKRVSSPVIINMPGGSLTIEWDGNPEHSVLMTGSATEVFEGVLYE